MKRLYSVLVLSLLLAAPAIGNNSLILNEGGGETRQNVGPIGGGGNGNSGDIPAPILDYILQLAAPQFNVPVRWLTIQYERGHVIITQISSNLYSVTYGGITIQILIESGSNWGGGQMQARPTLRN